MRVKRIMAGAATAVLAVSLTACGGGAPTDASSEDFCNVFVGAQDAETGADVRDFGEELEEVGTPDDISDEAREGFEVFVEAIADVDEDADANDLADPDLSSDEEKKFEAFISYAGETCSDFFEDEPPAE